MNKKRILVISSKPPFPVQNGAAIRTMQMLRMLSVFYDIDLIYTYTGQDSRAGLDKLSSNPQLSSSASFLRLNVLSSLN